MSVEGDDVASYHSHRRASIYTAPEKSKGFPTFYNPLRLTEDAKDRYGIRPLNHGTLSFDLNAAAVPATPVCLPSPSAATPTCLPSSNAAESTAPSASAFPASAVSPRPVSRVDAFDAARAWQHAIRKTFCHDPKFIVTEGNWKLTRADQIGHWVEGLAAAEDSSNALAKVDNGLHPDGADDPESVREFLRLPSDWNLPRPGMIFSVTGSATTDFDLELVGQGLGNWFKQRLHQFLARVIFGVAIKTQGWIIDGGSNVGIMKALGKAREHLQFPPSVPLIGMGSHMLNLPPHCLQEYRPQEYKVPPPPNSADSNKPCIDPNHSHFFFVGPKTSTTMANFGDENVFRRSFEVMASRRFKVPLVMFAFGGGENTIVQVRDAVNSGIHCWVVQGTGRFADLMAKLCKNPSMDVLNDNMFQKFHRYTPQHGRNTDILDTRRNFENIVAMYLAICRSPLLHVFDLEKDSFEGIIADLEKMKYEKPVVIATFSDASETMLREMNLHSNSTTAIVAPGDQSDTAAAAAATEASHQSNIQLVSVRSPSKTFDRYFSCYLFDFEAPFLNSKRISSAFVDLLRATCNTPTHNPRMILSYVFDPQHSARDQTDQDFSFLAAGLASRQIHPLWTFVASAPLQTLRQDARESRRFRDDIIKVDFDFQIFEFLSVDEAVFRPINTDMASMAEISPYLTVDASQLVVSNGKYLDSLHSLQRLQLDLQQAAEGSVPWCCVVSDNSKEDAIRQLNCVMASFRRGAFVVVVASALVTNFDAHTHTVFDNDSSKESTQESSLGLAPVMAAFIQMYSSYRNCLFKIMDKIFEACSLVGHHAPVDSKMGLNTFQIIEQCRKSVSKLVAHALENDNYLEQADFQRETDFGRRRLVFLEAFELLERICGFIRCDGFKASPTPTKCACDHYAHHVFTFNYVPEKSKPYIDSTKVSVPENETDTDYLIRFKRENRVLKEACESLDGQPGFDHNGVKVLYEAAMRVKETFGRCFDECKKNSPLYSLVKEAPHLAYSAIKSVLGNLKKLEWSQSLLSHARSLAASKSTPEDLALNGLRAYHDLVNIAESSSLGGSRAFVVTAWGADNAEATSMSVFENDYVESLSLQPQDLLQGSVESISQLLLRDEKSSRLKQILTMTKVTAQAITRIAVQSRQPGVHDMFNETALMLACVQNDNECVKTLLDPKACSNICYIATTSVHPRSIGQDALFMALNHLNFEAASCILNCLLRIVQSKSAAFDFKQHVGTRDIIKILEARHHTNRVNSLMLILRHGQLKLLETIWELLKAAEKRERRHPPEVDHVSRPDSNAYFAKEIMRRMLNGPGMYEDACAHHAHVEDSSHQQCECNGFDCNGQTAFHHAVRSQRECVVRWVIIHGGNICWQPPMSLQVIPPADTADTPVSEPQNSILKTREFFEQMFRCLAKHRKRETKCFINKHVKKQAELEKKLFEIRMQPCSRSISIDNENIEDCLHLFECFNPDRPLPPYPRNPDESLGLGSISFVEVSSKLSMLCDKISEHQNALQTRMRNAKLEFSTMFPHLAKQPQEQLNFQEFVVVFGLTVNVTDKLQTEEFCNCLYQVMSKIRNFYKMNYLKAAIGIRRSEDAGEKELELLRENYGIIRDIPLDELRKYQRAFEIFDLDDDKTIDIRELQTTLEKYGKEHQLMDCYSAKLKKNLEETSTAIMPFIVRAKKIIRDCPGVKDGFKMSRKFKDESLNLEEFIVFMKNKLTPESIKAMSLQQTAESAVARAGIDGQKSPGCVKALLTCKIHGKNYEQDWTFEKLSVVLDGLDYFKIEENKTHLSSVKIALVGMMQEARSSHSASEDYHEFTSFCANVLDIMLHTSNDLGRIYKTLDFNHQKTFRSTQSLGKLCQELLIDCQELLIHSKQILYKRGDPVWTDKNDLLEFTPHASCYVIPPFNTKSIKIELDYGDGKEPKEVGLGSMFGYEGAFEHRYRNHTAVVTVTQEKETTAKKGSVASFILYQIDLRTLKRLKDMGASMSNELFTQKELLFINNFRKAAGEFSQLQDNTSLASVTEHGKSISYSNFWNHMEHCDWKTVVKGATAVAYPASFRNPNDHVPPSNPRSIRNPYELSLLQWKVVLDHFTFCSSEQLPSFLSKYDRTDTEAKHRADDCFKIVELFRQKPKSASANKANGGHAEDASGSKRGNHDAIDDDGGGDDDDDGDDDDVNQPMYARIKKLNDDSQKWRWWIPFLLCGIFFVMLFFAATWHADSAFPTEEDPASEFYTLTKVVIREDLGIDQDSKDAYISTTKFVDFLNNLSSRWLFNDDTSVAVRIGLVKFLFKFNLNSVQFKVNRSDLNCSASSISDMTCGSVWRDNITNSGLPFSPDYSISLGDNQKWQDVVDAQAASNTPIFESAQLKFTLYSHAAKSLLHCHFDFRHAATGDISVHQKFTQLHSVFPWEEKQWYSVFMNAVFLPAVFLMALIPYAVKIWTSFSSFWWSRSFSNSSFDHLNLQKKGVEEKIFIDGAIFQDRRSMFVRTLAHFKFYRQFVPARRFQFISKIFKLFPIPEQVSLVLIILVFYFHSITNYKLSLLFSHPSATLQSVAVDYGSIDVDITSDRRVPFFYPDTRSSIQMVRYFLSAYIVLFAWRMLTYIALWPKCKPVFQALQMTIVDPNVVIFVLFIVVFSIIFAMSGLIAFGRQDEEHYGTPWSSWLTTFLYLTGEEQVRDILNKPSDVFSSTFDLDLSFLFPFGFYILCSIFGSLILCNLIVQTLNDVYTKKKEDSEEKYWQIANKYLAAIEMHKCIVYDTKQVWILMPCFSLIGVLAAAALFAAVAAVGGVIAGFLCTVTVVIVIHGDLAFSIQEMRWYQDWIFQPHFSRMGVLAATAILAAVTAVGGVTAGFFCTVAVVIVIHGDFDFIKNIQDKQWYKDWILQPYFSLTIDPDSIYQQITSLRLERHFRANHLQSN